MKWKKLGRIFNPTEHKLSKGCKIFAQSPQTIVFDDFVRIFFSTRNIHENGKYLSHVQFVDMDKSLQKLINISKNTVIELGALGTFDEHGIFPMNVLRYGNKILAYTSGWTRRVSVSVDTGIGLAFSNDDGNNFTRVGNGPVLTSSLHEPFLVCDPFVKVYEGIFHMWYIYGTEWQIYSEGSTPERTYKIGHAKSVDGIVWKKDGHSIIENKLDNECQALPTVINIDGSFHMFFCYRDSFGFRETIGRGYRLGYAFSNDGETWIRDDEKGGLSLSKEGWDSEMMCYPHIFKCDEKTYLLYNGNQFGRYGFGVAQLEEL